MKTFGLARYCAAIIATWSVLSASAAADTIKVGVLGPYSGPFATWGKQFKEGVEAFQRQHGTTVAGHNIEFLYRDLDNANPPQARALVQELVTKDKVQYLAGFVFTPNAAAAASVIEEAKLPAVVFNAAGLGITLRSNYLVRTSFTLPQLSAPIAQYAAKHGVKKVVTLVSDYAPGLEAEAAFKKTFESAGGAVIESIRMPLRTTDFGPFVQRAAAQKPDAVFVFLPSSGPPSIGMIKAYNDNGLRAAGIKLLGTAATDETDLDILGDSAEGILTSYHYSSAHESEANKQFLAALEKVDPKAIANFATVAAYDGTKLIYHMVAATKGKQDAAAAIAAVSGYQWESPRGPVRINPETRDIDQNVYVRVVIRDSKGKYINKEIETHSMQVSPRPTN
jgi:branched-chain amino acid transport system substrate-binding protein